MSDTKKGNIDSTRSHEPLHIENAQRYLNAMINELSEKRFRQRDAIKLMAKMEKELADLCLKFEFNLEAEKHSINSIFYEEMANVYNDMGTGKHFGIR